MPEQLIRAFDVAILLGYTTATIRNWALDGKLPGAVFLNGHVRFDPDKINRFIENGGHRSTIVEQQPRFTVGRYGHRGHAGGKPRNDRTRDASDSRLADLVKPDPGIRTWEYNAEINYENVESGRLLVGATTPGLNVLPL